MLLHPLCTAMELSEVPGIISSHYRESQPGIRWRQHILSAHISPTGYGDPPTTFLDPPTGFRDPPNDCRDPPKRCRMSPKDFRIPRKTFRTPRKTFRSPPKRSEEQAVPVPYNNIRYKNNLDFSDIMHAADIVSPGETWKDCGSGVWAQGIAFINN